MKIGVIARADHRGIGIQSYEFWRNMKADKALVVIMGQDLTNGRELTPYAQDPSRFNQRWVRTVTWNSPEGLDHNIVRDFLDGLDIVYCIETPYDQHFFTLCRMAGVTSVLHANPEFYRYTSEPDLVRPDIVWLPTPWLADRIPEATVMPFPVNRDHIPFRRRGLDPNGITFLHIVGHRTVRDRNGTQTIYRTLRYIRRTPLNIIIRSQSSLPSLRTPYVNARVEVADVADNADLYAEGDILLLPRKWGGLCLPQQEALSAGIPTLMTNCSPQSSFLPSDMLLPTRQTQQLRMQCGMVPVYDAHPRQLVGVIERLALDPSRVPAMSDVADSLASSISWDALRPVYFRAFTDALEGASRPLKPPL